jgi:hypothetical protein
MGISSGIVGGIGALAGLFGGGNQMPQAPPSFQMPNMGGAANNLFSGVQGLQPFTNLGQSSLGYGQNIFNALQGNPYGGGFQGGANVAGGLGQMQALGQYGIGQGLINQGQGAFGAGQQVLNTAFDPQQQLYQYLQNQNLQQTQAIQSGAGLATTPYGAGVSALSNQQFNMNWQNEQLQRQLAGLQGYGGALGTGANLIGQGNALQAAAPGQYYQSSGLPYATYNQLGNDQYANLNQLLGVGASGGNLANLENTGWQNYLQLGNQANQVQNQLYGLQLQAQNQGFNQNMLLGSALGGSLYRLGNPGNSPLWSNMFSGGGGGGYASQLASGSFI